MSVLIKGMDMPKEFVKAEIYKDKDDKWVIAVKDKEYYTDTGFTEEYELVEVPTLHGILADCDAEKRANLLNALQEVADSYGYVVAGYNDETEDDGFFNVLLLKENHMEDDDERAN